MEMNLTFALLWNTALFSLLLAAQVMARSAAHGLSFALSSLDKRVELSTLEERLARVKGNQLEFLILLLVLFALDAGVDSTISYWTALTLVVARSVYILVATAGIPVVRSLTWLVSFAALLVLAFSFG